MILRCIHQFSPTTADAVLSRSRALPMHLRLVTHLGYAPENGIPCDFAISLPGLQVLNITIRPPFGQAAGIVPTLPTTPQYRVSVSTRGSPSYPQKPRIWRAQRPAAPFADARSPFYIVRLATSASHHSSIVVDEPPKAGRVCCGLQGYHS